MVRFAATPPATTSACGARPTAAGNSARARLVRSATVDLRISRAGGPTLFRHRGVLSEIVPRTRIRYPIAWRGRPAPGGYRVHGTIAPVGAPVVRVDETVRFGGKDAERAEAQTGTPGPATPPSDPPVLLLAALAVALLLAGTAAAGYLRLRRRLSAAV